MLLESLEELRVFVQVVDSGGFTGAAQTLGTTTNAVSRLIARLESRLQVRLLSRTTRRVASTEEGRKLYEHALRLLRAADEAEQSLHPRSGLARGHRAGGRAYHHRSIWLCARHGGPASAQPGLARCS